MQILKNKPIKDPKYRRYINAFPCVACHPYMYRNKEITFEPDGYPLSECAHIGKTGNGMGAKCCDRETVPMCEKHHRTGKKAIHNTNKEQFEDEFSLNLDGIALALNKKYEEGNDL